LRRFVVSRIVANCVEVNNRSCGGFLECRALLALAVGTG
jgi:hypothetical protein